MNIAEASKHAAACIALLDAGLLAEALAYCAAQRVDPPSARSRSRRHHGEPITRKCSAGQQPGMGLQSRRQIGGNMIARRIFAPVEGMSIEFSPAVINAVSPYVVTLDRHPLGAVAFVGVILAGGAAVALSKWRRK